MYSLRHYALSTHKRFPEREYNVSVDFVSIESAWHALFYMIQLTLNNRCNGVRALFIILSIVTSWRARIFKSKLMLQVWFLSLQFLNQKWLPLLTKFRERTGVSAKSQYGNMVCNAPAAGFWSSSLICQIFKKTVWDFYFCGRKRMCWVV